MIPCCLNRWKNHQPSLFYWVRKGHIPPKRQYLIPQDLIALNAGCTSNAVSLSALLLYNPRYSPVPLSSLLQLSEHCFEYNGTCSPCFSVSCGQKTVPFSTSQNTLQWTMRIHFKFMRGMCFSHHQIRFVFLV